MTPRRLEVPALRGALVILILSLVLVAWASSTPRGGAPRVGGAGLQDASELSSNDGAYRVRYALVPAEPEVRELFELRVEVTRTDGALGELELAVDARMPEHGHGMNREPLVRTEAAGEFQVSNMLFHMPGLWELYFDVTEGALTERAQVSLELE
jgi:hypothetical protein